MKNKILAIVLAGALTMTTITPVFATPNEEVLKTQQQYEELTAKIDEIQGKIYSLNEQISPLVEKIESNKQEIQEIENEIENTNKEIEAAKEDISEQEEVLGKRVRELYKSGGQGSYLTLLFTAESFSDLISKMDSASRLVNIDKKIVQELQDNKEKLDNKVSSLEEKSNEIAKINEENNQTLTELEDKKVEQESLIEEVKAEQAKFDEEYLAVAERSLVEYQLGVLSSSNDVSEIENAISQLRSIRDNQLKSPTVIEEVNNNIETAKVKVEELKEQLAQLEAQQQENNSFINRGEIPGISSPGVSNPGVSSGSVSGSAIVSYAYQFIGYPYVYGATGPNAFDCSGFTSYVYMNAAGIDITRTTYSQIGVGTPVSYSELQPGDLVFTYNNEHVGIYVGGGQYIHAPQPGDNVKVSPITSFYAARRVIN